MLTKDRPEFLSDRHPAAFAGLRAMTGYRQAVPEVAMRREASVRMAQAASKLGLSPSDRSGLHVEVPVDLGNDPFAEFDGAKKPNKFARRGRSSA